MAGELITRDAQLEFNGLLLGDRTDFEITSLTGWSSTPPVDSGNAARAGDHGSSSGRPLAQQRIVTVEFNLTPESALDTEAAVDLIEAATVLAEDATELPIVVRPYGIDSARIVFGKVLREDLPMAQGYQHRRDSCAIQWECSDPRKYSLALQELDIVQPGVGSGGLDWPLTYPLDWGDPGSPALGNAVNHGRAPSNPVITFTGPVTTPNLLNFFTNQMIEVDLDVADGQHLVIDTNTGLITYLGGVYGPTAASVPVRMWKLAPGPNPLVFRAAAFGPGANAHIEWRSAWW